MNYAARIKQVRISLGLSQAQVARTMGWSPPNYARIEKGRINPSLKSLEAIAAALDVPVSYLTEETPASAEIPVVAFASAGPGIEFTDQGFPTGAGMYNLPRPPGLSDPNAFAVEISGDSMVPKYLDGQVVVVDTRKQPVSGDYAVVGLVNGEKYVKRYRPAGGRIVLESVNSLYPPVVVEPQDIRFAYKIAWAREK